MIAVSTLALEVNDVGIVAAGDGMQWQGRSPGFALLDGSRLLVGEEAARRARLKPRWVANRFWDRLDSEPLGRPFPHQLRNADLAHAHLDDVWKNIRTGAGSGSGLEADAVLLCVPGVYSSRQLGLLMGIGRACEMPIAGIVDTAVAASAAATPAARALHLDLLLHRVVLTELRRDESLARQRVETDRGCGHAALMEHWAKVIAGRFVHQTRFDPFHQGSTEQELYDRLPRWLEEITRHGAALLTLEHKGRAHSAEVTVEQLLSPVRGSYRRIVDLTRGVAATGTRPALVLSEALARLPGLPAELAEALGSEVVVLGASAAIEGALRHRDLLVRQGESGVDYVVELPIDGSKGNPETPADDSRPVSEAATATRPNPPSHLLIDGVAHALDSDPVHLGVAVPAEKRGVNLTGNTAGISRLHCSLRRRGDDVVVEDHSTYGTFLNGTRIEGSAPLSAGDRLRLGTPGVVLQLIAVD